MSSPDDTAGSMRLLPERIEELLSASSSPNDVKTDGNSPILPAYFCERNLVAWILLTRSTVSDSDIQRIWKANRNSLEDFVLQTLPLISDNDKADTKYHVQRSILQLICQVLLRLPEELFGSASDRLGTVLVQVWSIYASDGQTPISVHSDMCQFLHLWMDHDLSAVKKLNIDIMSKLWNLNVQLTAGSSMMKGEERKTSVADPMGTDPDWEVLRETMESILDNNTDADSHEFSLNQWNESLLSVVQCHGLELLPNECLPSLLTWLGSWGGTDSSLPEQTKVLWNEFFLNWIQFKLPIDSHFRSLLTKDPDVLSRLVPLLLAHIVSPADTSAALRAVSWQTVWMMVDTCGWQWMVNNHVSGGEASSFGGSKTLCTLSRLASGEWRIQLQSNSEGHQQATALPVAHACSNILQSLVAYCAQLGESASMAKMISTAAILHIQESLQQCLMTTVEYLSSQEDDSSSSLKTLAIPLLGTLLAEIDVWELSAERNDEFIQSVIVCLSRLLVGTVQGTLTLSTSLLPGLTHFLASAEGDETRSAKMALLLEPSVDFLLTYWSATTNNLVDKLNDSVSWACSCTELVVSFPSSSMEQKRRLAVGIILWIQNVIQYPLQDLSQKQTAQLKSYLSLCVGCFIAMKDPDKEPGEHESRVILRALQICEQ